MSHSSTTQQPLADRLEISLANQQSTHAVDSERLVEAARVVLQDADILSAAISLAVVDDPTIHELNRQFLDHDWPTDVLSFVLDERDGHLEGEIVLSADTAAAEARGAGWSAAEEQLLYVIHGTLHLVGYDDKSPEAAAEMRAAESRYLEKLGITVPEQRREISG